MGRLATVDTTTGVTTKIVNMKNTGYNAVSVLIFNRYLIVGTYGYVWCYDKDNLDVIVWKNDLSGYGYTAALSLMMAYNTLIVGVESRIIALDPNSGAPLWGEKVKLTGVLTGGFASLAPSKGNIVAIGGGVMAGIALADGRKLWEDELKGLGYAMGTIITAEKPVNNLNEQPTTIYEAVLTRNSR